MSGRPVRRLLVPALALALAAPAVADVLHLRSGSRIRTANWWISGDTLHYESEAGTIGIPRAELVRVEPSDAPAAPSPPRTDASGPGDRTGSTVDAERAGTFAEAMRAGSQALARREFRTASDRFHDASLVLPRDPRPRVGYALAEIALGRDELARGAVLEGLVWSPDSADLHELNGDLLDREERLDDAVGAWRRAFALSPNDRLREKILKGERERNVARDLALTSTRHFTVRYDGDLDRGLAEDVLAFLEDRFEALCDVFRMVPEQPITVLLYGERAFRDVTRAPEWVGGLYDGKVRVPLGGLASLDGRARGVLVHELAHAFIHEKTRGNAPRWLHEGLAQRLEGRTPAPGDPDGVRALVRARGAAWADGGLSYPAALSLVDHLFELRGERGMLELLESLGEGRDLDDALRELYGRDYQGLCRGWARALERDGGPR